jgi:hypothetical protein
MNHLSQHCNKLVWNGHTMMHLYSITASMDYSNIRTWLLSFTQMRSSVRGGQRKVFSVYMQSFFNDGSTLGPLTPVSVEKNSLTI